MEEGVDSEDSGDLLSLSTSPLQGDTAVRHVSLPTTGAIATFIGTTRDTFQGRRVIRLEYEAFIPMAEKKLKSLCNEIRSQWDVCRIAIFHRLGVVPIGEASVVIAVSSVHRKEALSAVAYCIDQLKASVPIWKKEVYEGEESCWKENKECNWNSKTGQTDKDISRAKS